MKRLFINRFFIIHVCMPNDHEINSALSFRVRSTPRRPEQGNIPRRARSARRLARPKAEQVLEVHDRNYENDHVARSHDRFAMNMSFHDRFHDCVPS